MFDLIQAAIAALDRVRRERPLIHLITNFVTMNDVANVLLVVGARPVMAHASEEVEEITRAARALVLNLGTPSRERVDAMLRAGQAANAVGIPIVLDPVGVGASAFRKESAARILDSLRIAIVRGNAGEIGALAGIAGTQSGVDAAPSTSLRTSRAEYDRVAVAKSLAAKYRAVVAITGATDLVSDSARVAAVRNGTPLLQQVTGAGDMLSALIAASAAIESDAFAAAASALLWFGIAAERAAKVTRGIGSFRVALFDELGGLDADAITGSAKLRMTNNQ
jgi:hydroxyethylthiazole kinase